MFVIHSQFGYYRRCLSLYVCINGCNFLQTGSFPVQNYLYSRQLAIPTTHSSWTSLRFSFYLLCHCCTLVASDTLFTFNTASMIFFHTYRNYIISIRVEAQLPCNHMQTFSVENFLSPIHSMHTKLALVDSSLARNRLSMLPAARRVVAFSSHFNSFSRDDPIWLAQQKKISIVLHIMIHINLISTEEKESGKNVEYTSWCQYIAATHPCSA